MGPRSPLAAIIDWIDRFPAGEIGHWIGASAVHWPLAALAVLAFIGAVAVRDVRRLRAADAAERATRPR